MTRAPSPADLRCRLNPAHVDALATELHRLRCIPLFQPDPWTGNTTHADADRSHARVILMGLRDRGYTLTT